MNKFEFKLVKKYEGIAKERDVFENDFYQLTKTLHKDCGLIQITIYPKEDMDLPTISTEENYETWKVSGFKISTSSIGYIEKEKIEKLIEGYRVAIETVKILEKMFLEVE